MWSTIQKNDITSDAYSETLQNGGALIVAQGGRQLYEYRKEDASKQITGEEIFAVLGIKKS